MRRTVVAPIHTESENRLRRMHPMQRAGHTAKERQDVTMVLSQVSPPPPPRLAAAMPGVVVENAYQVTLTRISPGELDDDNLRGALKGVRDAVAAWLGVDDKQSKRLAWHYAQLPCPLRQWGLRIDIEDDDDKGQVIERILAGVPARYGSAGGGLRSVPKTVATKPVQQLLPGVPAWALLPWDQDGGEPVYTDLRFEVRGADAPDRFARAPARMLPGAASVRVRPGELVRLRATRRVVADLDGEVWLYQLAT